MDLIICLVSLPVTIPLMAICIVLIRLDSPGPALFVQQRVGKGGRPFRMYKFRTMDSKLDDTLHRGFMKAFVNGQIGGDEPAYDLSDRPKDAFRRAFSRTNPVRTRPTKVYKPAKTAQITRMGRLLRKTSMDELPQVFNVLKGEMSLVGPRPNVPWEVAAYSLWHHERLEVTPGITGLAQVRGRSAISFDRLVRYDIEYIEQRNLILDAKILWETVATVFRGVAAE
jgi:lipopolysaccharide/colanic/teichoic acid biosynthesis glycosyltransferase